MCFMIQWRYMDSRFTLNGMSFERIQDKLKYSKMPPNTVARVHLVEAHAVTSAKDWATPLLWISATPLLKMNAVCLCLKFY